MAAIKRECLDPGENAYSRPKQATVFYRGVAYLLDLVACRQGLVASQVRGEVDSMEGLAARIRVSRSTVSRFFSGRPTSLAVTLKILDALGLRFEQVARPATAEGDAGAATAQAAHRPKGRERGSPSRR
jgi:DNA-binding phage protein